MPSRMFDSLPVDTRGHRQIYDQNTPGRLRGSRVAATIRLVSEGDSLTDGFASVYDGVFSCATCDAYPGFDVVANADGPEGIGLRAATDCLLPGGAETVFTLTVRSGKVIVSDDLRPVFDLDIDRSPGYNSAAGQIIYSSAMAALGCAYGPVGSGSVSLVRLGSPSYGVGDGGRYVMVSFDDEAEPGQQGHLDLGEHGAVLARVDTRLWAYSMADYEVWASRAREMGLDPEALLGDRNSNAQVIDMPKGVYLFVHHQTLADKDAEGDSWPYVYADITLISPVV